MFATRDIAAGETVLVADDLYAHVLFREYRGEVCSACFTYRFGEKLPFKDTIHGLAFCSRKCTADYMGRCDEPSLLARAAVEKLIKSRRPRTPGVVLEKRPLVSEIQTAWDAAAEQAASIRNARIMQLMGPINNTHTKCLQRALARPVSSDVINFLLSAFLTIWNAADCLGNLPHPWGQFLELEQEPTPYLSASELADYTASYLHLVAVLPKEMVPFVSSEMLHTIKTCETHNCFGIRSLDDEGSEVFGYGVWPSASYFNHSCNNNIRKRRSGRTWVFEAMRDITAGEQLCISYIGGEDGNEEMGRRDKATDFGKTWGFEHVCDKCRLEQQLSEVQIRE